MFGSLFALRIWSLRAIRQFHSYGWLKVLSLQSNQTIRPRLCKFNYYLPKLKVLSHRRNGVKKSFGPSIGQLGKFGGAEYISLPLCSSSGLYMLHYSVSRTWAAPNFSSCPIDEPKLPFTRLCFEDSTP